MGLVIRCYGPIHVFRHPGRRRHGQDRGYGAVTSTSVCPVSLSAVSRFAMPILRRRLQYCNPLCPFRVFPLLRARARAHTRILCRQRRCPCYAVLCPCRILRSMRSIYTTVCCTMPSLIAERFGRRGDQIGTLGGARGRHRPLVVSKTIKNDQMKRDYASRSIRTHIYS